MALEILLLVVIAVVFLVALCFVEPLRIFVFALFLIIWAILKFIFRFFIALLVVGFLLLRSVLTVRWGVFLVGLGIFFGVGLVFIEFQEEVMTFGGDVTWECGITRSAQITASVLHFVVRLPYEFIAEQWNRILLFLVDTVAQLVQDLQMLVRISRLASVKELLSSMTEEIFVDGSEIADAIKYIFRIIRDGFIAIGNFIVCFIDYFIQLMTSVIVTRTIFNQDCTFCALDPPIDANDQPLGTELSCAIREPFPSSVEPDCFVCNDFLAQVFGCTGDFIGDLIPNEVLPFDLGRVMRALACILNSGFKPISFIFQGIIDNIINPPNCVDLLDPTLFFDLIEAWFLSDECGKPSGCSLLSEGGTDLPIGIIPCWNELIQALTNDEIDDFFELIFAFLFEFIQKVIDSIVGIVDCFADQEFEDCLERYPTFGTVGEPGVCQFDISLDFPEDLIPIGGIADCFEMVGTCLNNPDDIPLLIPLVESGILDFLFGDFWRVTVDFATCPFALFGECFEPPIPACPEGDFGGEFSDLNDAICGFKCVEDEIPAFSFLGAAIAEILIVIGDIIGGILDAAAALEESFDCLDNCSPGDILDGTFFGCFEVPPDGCAKKRSHLETAFSEEEIQKSWDQWRNFLWDDNIYNDTVCGTTLHGFLPTNVSLHGHADQALYWECFTVLAASHPWKAKCGPDLVDVGGIMTLSTFPRCLNSLVSCIHQHHQNMTFLQREKKEKEGVARVMRSLNKINDTRSQVALAFKEVGFYKNIILPQWNKFKTSIFYNLTIEFGQTWKTIKTDYHEIYAKYGNETAVIIPGEYNPSITDVQHKEEKDLEELYITYVNAFIWNYRVATNSIARKQRRVSILGKDIVQAPVVVNSAPGSLVQYQAAVAHPYFSKKEYSPLEFANLAKKKEAFHVVVQRVEKTKRLARNMSKPAMEVWSLLNQRYNLEYWPSVERIGAVLHTLRTRNFREFWEWVNGKKGFLVSKGFIENTEYEEEMSKRDILNEGSLLDLVSGNYSTRKSKVYRPFPISAEYNYTPPILIGNASKDYAIVHHEQQLKRQHRRDLGFSRVIRRTRKQNRLGDITHGTITVWDSFLGFTKSTLNMFNGFYAFITPPLHILTGFSFFAPSEQPLNVTVTEILNDFNEGDVEDFFLEDLPEFLERFFSCAIPENIDGTELFSPFCIMLLPENLFELLGLTPNDVFPLQLSWPNELIEFDCTNVYNGNNDLFFFELSDNCEINDGQPRPFCPECDHCRKQYRSCGTASCLLPNGTRVDADKLCDLLGGNQTGEAQCQIPVNDKMLDVGEQCEALGGTFQRGFGDVLDNLLYIIAVLPRVLNEFFTGGLLVKDVESVFNLVAGFIFLPFLISVITIPFYAFFVGTVTHLITWIVFQLIGENIPWGLLTLIAIALILFFISQLSLFYGIVIGVLVVFSLLWIVSLFVVFPDFADLNLIEGLIDFFTALDEFPLLFWVDFSPLIERLEEFNYGSGSVPDIDTFCFFWTFSNIALLILSVFFGIFAVRLLWRWFQVILIFIFELIIAFFIIWRRIRLWILRKDVDSAENKIDEHDDKIVDMQTKINNMWSNLIDQSNPSQISDIIVPMYDVQLEQQNLVPRPNQEKKKSKKDSGTRSTSVKITSKSKTKPHSSKKKE